MEPTENLLAQPGVFFGVVSEESGPNHLTLLEIVLTSIGRKWGRSPQTNLPGSPPGSKKKEKQMDYTSGISREAYLELPRLAHLISAARQEPEAYRPRDGKGFLAIRATDGRVVEVFVGSRGGIRYRLYRAS